MSAPAPTRARRTVALLMLVLYAALIFGGSSGPAPDAVVEIGAADPVLHVAEYAVLGFLASRWLLHQTRRTGWVALVVLPGLLAAGYGVTDELHQAFVRSRDASFSDLWADAAGGFLGAILYRTALRAHLRPAVAAMSLLLVMAGASSASGGGVEADLEAHREFLESPELASVEGPFAGVEVASRYLSTKLALQGLAAGGRDGSWFLPAERTVREDRGESLLRLLEGETGREFTGEEIAVGRGSPDGDGAGPLVFVGRGDLAGLELRGRVVLALGDGQGRSVRALSERVARRGGVALLVAPPPEAPATDPEEGALIGKRVSAPPVGLPRWSSPPSSEVPLPVLAVSTRVRDALLAGTDGASSPFEVTGRTAVVRVRTATREWALRHVVGRLPGPAGCREVLLVTAGFGPSEPGGEFRGRGAALLLAAARALSEGPGPRARTVLFLAVAAGGGDSAVKGALREGEKITATVHLLPEDCAPSDALRRIRAEALGTEPEGR